MGISEPSSPLWAAVKAIHDSWPQDDETVAADLGTEWQRGGDMVAQGGTESGRVGTDVRTAWYDDAGAAFGTRVGEYATVMGKVAAQMKALEARGAHYARELTATKNSIVSTISDNEESYAFLANPIFGKLGPTFQNWFATSIANDLKDMVTEKAAALRANPTGAPPPPPPAAKKPEDDGWSFSDIGHAVLDVVGLIPVVGEVADGANAVWYAAEGDYLSAALSAAAMIPGAGWAATGAKYGAKYADEAVALVDDAASALTKTGDDAAQLATRADDVPGAGPSLAGGPSAPTGALDAAPSPSSATPNSTLDAPAPTGAADTAARTDGGPTGPGNNGGGSPDSPAPSRPADPTDTRLPAAQRVCVNDPIDVASGEMVLTHVDVELPGLLPLVLRRTHVSTYRCGRLFGTSWSSTVDQRLELDGFGAVFVAEDGMRLVYPTPGAGTVLPEVGPRWPLVRDGAGFRITAPGSGISRHFDHHGALTAITHRAGHRIDVERDRTGMVTGVRHSGGYRVAVDSSGGLVTGLRLTNADRDIELVAFRYDSDRRLVEVVNSSGRPLRYDYDAAGRITGWQDRNDSWYRYVYDEHGRCVRNVGADGFLDGNFEYLPDRTVFSDSLGHPTTYHLNELRQVVWVVDALGNAVETRYDHHDRPLSRTDQLGATTRYTYDGGDLVEVRRPDGTRSTAEFDKGGAPLLITEPGGAQWRWTYDDQGNVTSVTNPVGALTTYTYDRLGVLATVTDALGATRRITSDAAGLPIAVTEADGATTRYDRDVFGRVVAVVDPVGGVTRMSWTVEGRLAGRILPDGATERWNHDGEGNVDAHVDPLGQVSRFEHTHFDLPAAETGPDGARVAFGYDTNLRLTSVTDARDRVWHYEYDAVGRLVREIDFDGRVMAYTHDAAGRLSTHTNGIGAVTTFTRDVMGNVVERTGPDVSTTLERDTAGRITAARNADAELVIERDAVGRVRCETVNGRGVASEYDLLGRRVLRTTPSGAQSRWDFDVAGRAVALHTADRTVRFGYDQAGREVERQLAGVAVLTKTWDRNHRLSSQAFASAAAAVQRSYGYRADGNLMVSTDQLTGDREYELDPVGRITGVRDRGWTERYAYDPAGNLVAAHWPTDDEHVGAREYAGSRISRAGAVRFEHDEQGRVTARRSRSLSGRAVDWRYRWSSEDRLVEVVTPDGRHWHYRYDPLGRRIAKEQRAVDGTVVERVDFTWDGQVLAEQTTAGRDTVWDWQPGTFHVVSQRERDAVAERFYAIVTDLVGTPTELVTDDGEVAWRSTASVWGRQTGVWSAGVHCPLRFPGQYHDLETGLYYNRHRYYDATTARYVSADPLGLRPASNQYAYVSNPLGWTDPLGLKCVDNQSFNSRQEAMDAAYDRAGVPRGTEPDASWDVGADAARRGQSNYRYDDNAGAHGTYRQFETEDGSRVVAEHTNDPRAPQSHFHAGQPAADPSRDGVNFGWDKGDFERYKQIDGAHHYYYPEGT